MIDRLFEFAGCEDHYRDAFGASVVVSTGRNSPFSAPSATTFTTKNRRRRYFLEKLAEDSRRVQPVYVVKVGKALAFELLDVLDADTPIGYYPVEIMGTPTTAIVVPNTRMCPKASMKRRRLNRRSTLFTAFEENWGIGDFGDLLSLVDLAKRAGASTVALIHCINCQCQIRLTRVRMRA